MALNLPWQSPHQTLDVTGIDVEDLYLGHGVSELIVMAMRAMFDDATLPPHIVHSALTLVTTRRSYFDLRLCRSSSLAKLPITTQPVGSSTLTVLRT
jgi:hypothetical protein